MDTLTHALLGGSLGVLIAGKNAPRKALLWGAAFAALPDLDVFVPHANDLAAMTWHRSWSHSWIIQSAIALLFASILYRFDKTLNFKTWWLLIWFVLVTHSGLDALTVYGTQLFWPFMPPPISGGSIFIVDPLFSIPLLIGFVGFLIRPRLKKSRSILLGCLGFSGAYLLWGLVAQNLVHYQAEQVLARKGIATDKVQVTAAPFTTLLWRVLVIDGDSYYEGFHSVFDNKNKFDFKRYPRDLNLETQIAHSPSFERFSWFNNGYFKLEQKDRKIIATDLRMGLEPVYFFRFDLANENASGQWQLSEPNRVHSTRKPMQGIKWVWRRIWQPDIYFKIDSTAT